MVGLVHPNVLSIVAISSVDHIVYIVTPFCSNGSLFDYLSDQNVREKLFTSKNSTKIILNYLKQISKGMEYLASERIIHCDLATRNVFLDHKTKCRIGDFGQSHRLEINEVFFFLIFDLFINIAV